MDDGITFDRYRGVIRNRNCKSLNTDCWISVNDNKEEKILQKYSKRSLNEKHLYRYKIKMIKTRSKQRSVKKKREGKSYRTELNVNIFVDYIYYEANEQWKKNKMMILETRVNDMNFDGRKIRKRWNSERFELTRMIFVLRSSRE